MTSEADDLDAEQEAQEEDVRWPMRFHTQSVPNIFDFIEYLATGLLISAGALGLTAALIVTIDENPFEPILWPIMVGVLVMGLTLLMLFLAYPERLSLARREYLLYPDRLVVLRSGREALSLRPEQVDDMAQVPRMLHVAHSAGASEDLEILAIPFYITDFPVFYKNFLRWEAGRLLAAGGQSEPRAEPAARETPPDSESGAEPESESDPHWLKQLRTLAFEKARLENSGSVLYIPYPNVLRLWFGTFAIILWGFEIAAQLFIIPLFWDETWTRVMAGGPLITDFHQYVLLLALPFTLLWWLSHAQWRIDLSTGKVRWIATRFGWGRERPAIRALGVNWLYIRDRDFSRIDQCYICAALASGQVLRLGNIKGAEEYGKLERGARVLADRIAVPLHGIPERRRLVRARGGRKKLKLRRAIYFFPENFAIRILVFSVLASWLIQILYP